jgi:hypothetical protein
VVLGDLEPVCGRPSHNRRKPTVSDEPADLEDEVVDSTLEEEPQDTPADDVGALKRALEREREERKQAKEELRRLREDEDHRRQWLGELGYEITSDDDVDPEDDPDFADDVPDVDHSVLEKRLAAIEAERAQERYERDLSRAVGDRDLSEQGRDYIQFQTMKGGNNPDALKKAVKAWFEFEDGLRSDGVAALRKSKKAPHVPGSGKAATQTPNWKDMSEDDEIEYMVSRISDR